MNGSFFANLSMPVKLVVAILAGAGLLSVAMLVAGEWGFLVALAVGLVLVGLLIVLYLSILRWRRKRRGAEFERSLRQGAKASGVTSGEDLATLDDLQKTFDEGIQRFRARGKDLYELPWYLIIGESGSGKTEAIRHCNVGFPPGLQDELQGVGGTVNMNWWFTNKAVILDTAGKMVFPSVETGQTREWHTFLDLLKRQRRDCPINGLILVIPADGFFLTEKDRREGLDLNSKIEKKSNEIAQQLENIKQKLEVRFPVYLVITKSDLIVGFREFFDDLDVSVQQQLLGWSKPGPLDEPFHPEDVSQYLETVRDRLLKFRLGHLLDPVDPSHPERRRTDQVDSLYTFPNNLVQQIGFALRMYLEQIFAPSVWSGKPLLFRGIYFTSAMREGAELDEEIAAMLDVPIDSLPEGGVWEKEKSFFLRDLFLGKMFPEKGLVTRASNIGKVQTRRRAILLGAGILSVLVLIVMVWVYSFSLREAIGDRQKFWAAIKNDYLDVKNVDRSTGWRIVARQTRLAETYDYKGADPIELPGSRSARLYQLPSKTLANATEEISRPGIFRFMPGERNILKTERLMAHRALFESVILRPLYEATMSKMTRDRPSEGWRAGEGKTAALATFLQTLRIPHPSEESELGSLFRYVDPELPAPEGGSTATADVLREHLKELHAALRGQTYWTVDGDGSWDEAGWKKFRESLLFMDPETKLPDMKLGEVAERAVEQFATFWKGQDPGRPRPAPARPEPPAGEEPATGDSEAAGGENLVVRLNRLQEASDALRSAEDGILAIQEPGAVNAETHEALIAAWDAAYSKYSSLLGAMHQASDALQDDLKKDPDFATKKSPEESVFLSRAMEDCGADLKTALGILRKAAGEAKPPEPGGDHVAIAEGSELAAVRRQLDELDTWVTKECRDFVVESLLTPDSEAMKTLADVKTPPNEPKAAHYRRRADAYALAANVPANAGLEDFAVETAVASAMATLQGWEPGADAQLKEAIRLSRLVLRAKYWKAADSKIRALPHYAAGGDPAPFVDQAQAMSLQGPDLSSIPMTTKGDFEIRFHPDFLAKLKVQWENLEKRLFDTADGKQVPTALALDGEKLAEAYTRWREEHFGKYVAEFAAYWSTGVLSQVRVSTGASTWAEFQKAIGTAGAGAAAINKKLRVFAELRKSALDGLGGVASLLPEESAKSLADARSRANAALGSFGEKDFDDRCTSSVSRWFRLGPDFHAAKSTICGMTPVDLGPYVQCYGTTEYWSSLVERALSLIVADAKKEASDTLASVVEKDTFKKFPLVVKSNGSSLGPAEVESLHETLQKTDLQALGAEATAAPDGLTLCSGAVSEFPKINTLLEQMARGARGVFASPKQEKWFQRLFRVVEFLNTRNLKCTLVIVNQERKELQKDIRDETTGELLKGDPLKYREFRVVAGPEKLTIGDRSRLQKDGPHEGNLLADPGKEVRLQFFAESSDLEAGAEALLGRTWAAIEVIHRESRYLTRLKDEGILCVPLFVRGTDPNRPEKPYYYWIGLKFEPPIPDLEEWPTAAGWGGK